MSDAFLFDVSHSYFFFRNTITQTSSATIGHAQLEKRKVSVAEIDDVCHVSAGTEHCRLYYFLNLKRKKANCRDHYRNDRIPFGTFDGDMNFRWVECSFVFVELVSILLFSQELQECFK